MMAMEMFIPIACALISVALALGFVLGRLAMRCARPHLPTVDGALLTRARELVRQQEVDGGNGELKRHRAYARLLKDFPRTPARQIALAIESAHEDL